MFLKKIMMQNKDYVSMYNDDVKENYLLNIDIFKEIFPLEFAAF